MLFDVLSLQRHQRTAFPWSGKKVVYRKMMRRMVKKSVEAELKYTFLRQDERRVAVNDTTTPLVVEPRMDTNGAFRQEADAELPSDFLMQTAQYGATLIRGFPLRSDLDFEKFLVRAPGLCAISDVMMLEDGRTIVDGTRAVFHTNTLFKTGGTLAQASFHTENYYLPDVPAYIAFFCKKPSLLGGETGLVNTARVYADLPAELQYRLEKSPFFVRAIPIHQIAKRYGLSDAAAESFCASQGMQIEVLDGMKNVCLFKPSVIAHPLTGEKALAINFAGELNRHGLMKATHRAFAHDYRGLRWILHRLNWSLVNRYRHHKPARQYRPRIGTKFTSAEIGLIAHSMRKHFSSFRWQTGDVLLVDNVKMAHAGMPGFGERELRAMIFNRMAVPLKEKDSGLFEPKSLDGSDTVGALLSRVVAA